MRKVNLALGASKSQSWVHGAAAGIKEAPSFCVSVVLGPEPWHNRPVYEAPIHPHDPLPKAMFLSVRLEMVPILACFTI